MHRSHRILVLAVLAAVSMAALARSAASSPVSAVVLGAGYRSWDSKGTGTPDGNAAQSAGRMAMQLQWSPAVDMVVATSGGSSQLDPGTGRLALSGFSSLSSSIFWHLDEDRIVLQGTVSAPFGKTALTTDEVLVAEAIGQPLLGFDLKHYGSGLEAGGSATLEVVGQPGMRLTVGGGGVTRGSYKLIANTDDFHPAPEGAVTAGLDLGAHEDGSAWPLRTDLTYRTYGTDQVGSTKVFQEGQQFELRGQGDARTGDVHWSAIAMGVIKDKNAILGAGGSTVGDTKTSSGNSTLLRLLGDRPAGTSARIGLVLEESLVSGSDDPGRNGSVTSVGPTLRLATGPSTTLDLTAEYAFGKIDSASGGPQRDLSGLAMGVRMRWMAGR